MRSAKDTAARLLGGTDSAGYRGLRYTVQATRRARHVTEGFYRRRTGRLVTVNVGPYKMKVPEDMRWAYAGGTYYERSFAHVLQRLVQLKPQSVFFDVGGNYGYYTLLLAERAAAVHTFEPVTTTHAQLRANIEANRVSNVTLHKTGLSDHDGTANIRLFSSSGNNSLYDVNTGDNVRQVGIETIRLATIDGMISSGELPPPDLIKMDVEGAELSVLRGARSTLRRHRPTLTAEFYAPHFEKAGYTADDLLDELVDLGYAILGVPEGPGADTKLRPLDALANVKIGNIVAVDPARVQQLLTQ